LNEASRSPLSQPSLGVPRILELLRFGDIEVEGLVPWGSNFTFIASVGDSALQATAIYKPSRGERPLWDFRQGSLCRREVAAFVVSQHLGWPAIPPVVVREGPLGPGSLQLFVEIDPDEHYFTMRRRPEYEGVLQRIALFDYAVNNADRKGGHILMGTGGQVWAIDHGLTFHLEPKLRTVIWEYAGAPVPRDLIDELRALYCELALADGPLAQALLRLLDDPQVAALRQRLGHLLQSGVFPLPRKSWRNVPYPPI